MDPFYIENFVDERFATGEEIDHESIANSFLEKLEGLGTTEFEELLIISGFIPDLYKSDSSKETLYTKLIEALVCEWVTRLGGRGTLVKQKASYEDVSIDLAGRVVVCDAKSFRLGRSQQAPNAKDFLKLEDIRKWLSRYGEAALGGLVVYPCKHEWRDSSDVYQYCSTKDAPTLMLPFKKLAFLLNRRDSQEPSEAYVTKIRDLWDYDRLFPEKLPKKMAGGNKKTYWEVIDNEILRITGATREEYEDYLSKADKLIRECILSNIKCLQRVSKDIEQSIKQSIEAISDMQVLKKTLTEYKIERETFNLKRTIDRISEFRLH